MAEYNKQSTEESPDTQTFAPSKIDCIVKAVTCLVIVAYPLYNDLTTESDEQYRLFLIGVCIVLLYIFLRLIVRMYSRLTISKHGLCLEGRNNLLLSHQKTELSFGRFEYCRTRKVYWHRFEEYYFLLLDFFDAGGTKIKTIRIDYFEHYDKIIEALDKQGKLNKEKCTTSGELSFYFKIALLSLLIFAILVVVIVILTE